MTADALAAADALARALFAAHPSLEAVAGHRYQALTRLAASGTGWTPDAATLTAALVADVGLVSSAAEPGHDREAVAVALRSAALLAPLHGLDGVATIIRHLRERWDGSGGPTRLAGPDIPVECRALAVADAFAADMTSGDRRGRLGRLRTTRGSVIDPGIAADLALALDDRGASAIPPTVNACFTDLRRRAGIRPSDPSLGRLAAAAATVRQLDDPVELVDQFADDARRALGAATVSVGELKGDELRVLVHTGRVEPPDELRPADECYPLAAFPSFSGIGTAHATHLCLSTASLDAPFVPYLTSRGISSEISCPITVDGQLWGSFWATSATGEAELGAEALDALSEIATDIGAVLAATQRLAALQDYAFRDALTGLYNRRVLETELRKIFDRPPSERLDVALVMCDVDGLKIVNDSIGHEEGDVILKDAAAALREATSATPEATVCRIGGDEFCIILDGRGALMARPLADDATLAFQRKGPNRSMSCGVAILNPAMRQPGELLRAADVAQYEEKRRRQDLGLAPVRPISPPGRRAGRRARRDQ